MSERGPWGGHFEIHNSAYVEMVPASTSHPFLPARKPDASRRHPGGIILGVNKSYESRAPDRQLPRSKTLYLSDSGSFFGHHREINIDLQLKNQLISYFWRRPSRQKEARTTGQVSKRIGV
jgi:hypothetical protein